MSSISQTDIATRSNEDIFIFEDIILDNDMTVASGAILHFTNGAQIRCGDNSSEFNITFNNNTIIASDYQLFTSYGKISGTLTNAEINADWFGAKENGMCSKAVNTALSLNTTPHVVMPSRRYRLGSTDVPIVINRNGTTLTCTGGIVCPSECDCESVINVRASNVKVNIRRMDKIGASIFSSSSAIKISGFVCDSDFKFDFIYGFPRGLEITPKFELSQSYIGILNCRFEWQVITCRCDIFVDLFSGLDDWSEKENEKEKVQWPLSVDFAGNYFKGGRLQGKKGIYFEPQPSMFKIKYRVYTSTENIFDNIGFERRGQRSISLNGCDNFTFKNCRLSEGELTGENHHGYTRSVVIDHCRNVRIDNKCDVNTDRICACEMSSVAFRGYNTTLGEVLASTPLKSDITYSGEIPVSGHFDKSAINRVYNYTCSGSNSFPFINILPEISVIGSEQDNPPIKTFLVPRIVCINVSAGETHSIRCNKKQIMALPEILLRCVLSNNSTLNFTDENNIIIRSITNNTTEVETTEDKKAELSIIISTGELFKL